MLSLLLLLIINLLVIVSFYSVSADLGYYKDTNAAYIGNIHLGFDVNKIVQMNIVVSGNGYAGSTDTIYVTFVGDFASTLPTPIGPFNTPGANVNIQVPLEREIGEFKGIWIENPGYDSLLLNHIRCRIGSNVHEIPFPQTWLETFNPSIINKNNQDGFSPEADIDLPSSSTLYLPVQSTYLFYTSVGLYTKQT
jgi:hypothetical protein